MIRQRFTQTAGFVRQTSWRTRWAIFFIIAVLAGLVAYRYFTAESPAEPTERQLKVVRVQPLRQLVEQSTVPYQARVEPARFAPLVARVGGRVTAVKYQLGEVVTAGEVVLEIDGRHEANPGRAQIAGLNASLTLIDESEKQAVAATEIGITLAQSNVALTRATGPLSNQGAVVARQQADVAVRGAELALEEARELGVDQAITAADIALKSAGFAQDQATLNRQLTTNQQKISTQQAQLNVENALKTRDNTITQLAIQRQQLVTQLQVVQEQVRLQHVTTPLGGEVTRLDVRTGDFVQPGKVVGEVNALAGATVRLAVPDGVHDYLSLGQSVPLETEGASFTGTIGHIASAPASVTGLWQIDIAITSTPVVIHPSDMVTVRLPVGAARQDTYFLPLRTLAIRQGGAVLFTVEADQKVQAHTAEIIAFNGSFAEVKIDLPDEARVVVEGNRTITEGEKVTVTK